MKLSKREIWKVFGSGDLHSNEAFPFDEGKHWHCQYPDGVPEMPEGGLAYDPRCRACLIGLKVGLLQHPTSGIAWLTPSESLALADEMLRDIVA